jgi:hypothetical protein
MDPVLDKILDDAWNLVLYRVHNKETNNKILCSSTTGTVHRVYYRVDG